MNRTARRVGTSMAMVLAVLLSMPADDATAGGLVGSIERSIAKKAGQRTAARLLEKKAAGKTLTKTEEQELGRILNRLDLDVRDAILKRYGQYISREGKRRALESKTTFHNLPPQQGVYGWTAGGTTHVYARDRMVVTTTTHERLHQLAHPRFMNGASNNLNEGLTEFFAQQINRDIRIWGTTTPYTEEKRIAAMLAARVGEDPLAKAYFRGDFRELERTLDSQLGRGTFRWINRLMESREGYPQVEMLLRGH